MKQKPEFLSYFLYDILEGNPAYTTKSMFGGYAIYKQGKIFALYANDSIYFKVDDSNRSNYMALGSKPFCYSKKDGVVSIMSYYQIPEEILEDREKIVQWIDTSLQIESKKGSQKKK